MGFITKYKREIAFGILLLALYLLLRFLVLTQLPIFTDEAIYLRWAQIAKNDANWRFISLTDGKQPLFIWLVMTAMRFIKDPLVAGRIVSVIAGIFTMLGLFFLGREAFRNRYIGIVSAALYGISPFALVYDRMALYDSLVGTFAVWGLYFTVVLVRTLRLDTALLMGFVTGAAVLNKTNGFFSIYLLPFAVLLFDFKQKHSRQKLFRFILLAGIVVVMTYVFYSILRLSPFFYIIDQKNTIFVHPVKEWLQHPLDYFRSNFMALMDWYLHYVGLPMTVVALAAFIVNKKYVREKTLLFLWFVLPFIGLALAGKTIYPRYIFFMTLSLLPLAAFTLVTLYQKVNRVIFGLLLVLGLGYWIGSDVMIIRDFSTSSVPSSDKGQYLTAWPSGTGIQQAKEFFEKEAKTKPIFVGTQGTFGLLPYAFEIYFVDNKNITVKGFWPIDNTIPQELLEQAQKEDTYIVFYQDCEQCQKTGIAPKSWQMQEVFQIKRIEDQSFFTVYKILTP